MKNEVPFLIIFAKLKRYLLVFIALFCLFLFFVFFLLLLISIFSTLQGIYWPLLAFIQRDCIMSWWGACIIAQMLSLTCISLLTAATQADHCPYCKLQFTARNWRKFISFGKWPKYFQWQTSPSSLCFFGTSVCLCYILIWHNVTRCWEPHMWQTLRYEIIGFVDSVSS